MTIELNAHGMRYELWLRRSANDGRSAVEHKALPLHVGEVVAAGDPAITHALKLRGWAKGVTEATQAGADLLHVATEALSFIRMVPIEEDIDLADARRLGLRLQDAINAYTDNVAPPEDDDCRSYEIIHGQKVYAKPQAITVKAHRIVYPAGSEPLFDRAVLPDELDEDPELDADETDRQLYAIKHHQMNTKGDLLRVQTALADVAEIVFTQADDASACVFKLQELLRHDHLEAKPEGALDLSLAGNLRALLVCLDPDAADNLVEPFAVLERITVLVSELEARAADAEQSLSSAAEQLGKEALARVSATNALREAQDVTVRMLEEREAARGMVHAAVDVLQVYLGNRPIAGSFEGTRLNDAIHDWLDLQPESVATSATARFIENRMGVRESAPVELPSPKAAAWMPAGGITAAEFAAGVAKFPKPPSLPTDGYGNLLSAEETMGAKVANAAMWVLGKLFPKT